MFENKYFIKVTWYYINYLYFNKLVNHFIKIYKKKYIYRTSSIDIIY